MTRLLGSPCGVLRLLAVVLLAATAVSCRHKDLLSLDDDQALVRIQFDMDQLQQSPLAMRVYFYPILPDGSVGRPQMFDIRPEGGVAPLAEGDYQVVAYNVDPNNIIDVDQEQWSLFHLTSPRYEMQVVNDYDGPNQAPRRPLFGTTVPYEDDEYEWHQDAPDWTCTAHYDHFHVDRYQAEASSEGVRYVPLHLTVQEATVQVTFELTGATGLELATMVRATVSGVPDGHVMATGRPSSEPTLETFFGTIDHDNNVIRATARLWGYYPTGGADTRQYLNLYIWTERGPMYIHPDITEFMQSGEPDITADGTRIMHIHLDSEIDFYRGGTADDSGFAPDVMGWDEVSSNIQL